MSERLTRSHISALAGREHGVHLHFHNLLHGGVSGDRVYKVRYGHNKGESHKGVIKIGNGIGEKETRGAQRIGRRLPIIESIVYGRDYVLYPFIAGDTVDKAVQKNKPQARRCFSQFTQLHANLWQKTEQSHVSELDGYPKKMDQTKQILFEEEIKDIQGTRIPLEELAHHQWIVNGRPVGKITDIWEQTKQHVLESGIGALSHGDEGSGNGIISNADQEIIVIDHGAAGIRAIEEPIAKILLWFETAATSIQGYNMKRDLRKVTLTTETSLPTHIVEAITDAREQLEPWMAKRQDKQRIAAYMITYLWRTMQYVSQRGREDMLPHLLAKALSFTSAFEGAEQLPFPLSPTPSSRRY